MQPGNTKTADRKRDHIDLAFNSATSSIERDPRFNYEPLLATHPDDKDEIACFFVGKQLRFPIWVSSMTGGTGIAKNINRNLARACKDFGLGMGLGSCRKLLQSDEFLEDFAVRSYIGDQPLYANLGIAQIIELIQLKQEAKILEMIQKLEADGLIIHINPIQEWLQPEGDRITTMRPIDAIEHLLEKEDYKIIVKEVGQGMGPESLKVLLALPLTPPEIIKSRHFRSSRKEISMMLLIISSAV